MTPWSVESKQYGEFLCAIFDHWVRRDVGRIFVQMFDVALGQWMGMRLGAVRLCARHADGALALEHNGDLYACDHYVYPEYRLGNMLERELVRRWWIRRAAEVRTGQVRHAAELLPAVRGALRLQRRVPEASVPEHAGRGSGLELFLRGLQAVFPPHRLTDATDGGAIEAGPAGVGNNALGDNESDPSADTGSAPAGEE